MGGRGEYLGEGWVPEGWGGWWVSGGRGGGWVPGGGGWVPGGGGEYLGGGGWVPSGEGEALIWYACIHHITCKIFCDYFLLTFTWTL